MSRPVVQQHQDLRFSPDGRWLGVTKRSGIAQIWDIGLTNGEAIALGHDTNGVESIQFSPTSDHVVTAGGGNAKAWEISTGRLVSELPHAAASHFARFSPDGQWVLTASYDKTAQIWNWRTGQPRLPQPLRHDDKLVCADISSDSEWIATLSLDKTARIWNARTGRLRAAPLRHAEEPHYYNSIQFSPDGRRLVTAAGNAAQVWDAVTGQPLTAVLKHNARVNSVRFSSDNRRIVTACTDGAARIWDAETGHLLGEHLHQTRVNYAEFSADGRWVVTACEGAMASIWEVPQVLEFVPPWLGGLAEALAGQRLLEGDINEIVPFDKLAELRQTLSRTSASNEWSAWLQWFFSNNTNRALSPSSAITVRQYVERRIRDNTLASLQEATRLSPSHTLAQAKLAFAELTNSVESPWQMARSEWETQRALKLLPDDAEVWWTRAQVCQQLGKTVEAWEAMARASKLNSADAAFWNAWGLALEKTNRVDDAFVAYTKALELCGQKPERKLLRKLSLKNRSSLLRGLGRLEEAAVDNLEAYEIPKRDPAMPPSLIDLSLHYNRGLDLTGEPVFDFTAMPASWVTNRGVPFDIRGAIQLASGLDRSDTDAPKSVSRIRVQQKCHRLNYLHIARFLGVPQDGVSIGLYQIRYVDGQEASLPIVYGHNIRSCHVVFDTKEPLDKGTKVGWAGKAPNNEAIRVFVTTWNNPRPDVRVESLDFITHSNKVVPFLFAITAEP